MAALAERGDLVLLERLIALCPSAPIEHKETWRFAFGSALSEACELSGLQLLLQHPVGREASNTGGYESLLSVAAGAGQIEVVQFLVTEGFSDEKGEALLSAVEAGHLILVKWLLKHVPYPGGVEGDSVMDKAAENGHVDMLQFFQTLSPPQVHKASRLKPRTSKVGAWWT